MNDYKNKHKWVSNENSSVCSDPKVFNSNILPNSTDIIVEVVILLLNESRIEFGGDKAEYLAPTYNRLHGRCFTFNADKIVPGETISRKGP